MTSVREAAETKELGLKDGGSEVRDTCHSEAGRQQTLQSAGAPVGSHGC